MRLKHYTLWKPHLFVYILQHYIVFNSYTNFPKNKENNNQQALYFILTPWTNSQWSLLCFCHWFFLVEVNLQFYGSILFFLLLLVIRCHIYFYILFDCSFFKNVIFRDNVFTIIIIIVNSAFHVQIYTVSKYVTWSTRLASNNIYPLWHRSFTNLSTLKMEVDYDINKINIFQYYKIGQPPRPHLNSILSVNLISLVLFCRSSW